jgi:molecular chaperone HscB
LWNFVFSVTGISTCWHCSAPISESLFCRSCKSLQEPSRDYYRLLGLEGRRLNIDLDQLQRRFYELSRQLHPDHFMLKSEREKQHSEDATSVLNDAYRTLKDPIKRAQYVLAQEGFDIGEQRSSDVPPELLEEVFELNMALEEMRGGVDSARPQLESAENNFSRMLNAIDAELRTLFAAYDASPAREILSSVRTVLNRRKYIQNLLSEVQKTLESRAANP